MYAGYAMLCLPQPFWSDLDVFRRVRHLQRGFTRLLSSGDSSNEASSRSLASSIRLYRRLPSLGREVGGIVLLPEVSLLRGAVWIPLGGWTAPEVHENSVAATDVGGLASAPVPSF